MNRDKGVISHGSLIEFEEIARSATRAALEDYEIPVGLGDKLVLGTLFDGDERIFELYIPGERPADATVISSARVNTRTKQVVVEVFNLKKRHDA